ncbi:MAG: two-component system sensor histidine kinase CreC, partial [Verrucomicrobiota bacterium]
MKIRTRIFLIIIVLVGAGFYYLIDWINSDMRPRYMESVEETLVDTAHLLAAMFSSQLEGEDLPVDGLRRAFDDVQRRRFEARIYALVKTNVDVRIYVTETNGLVLFDSDGGKDEGKDYSKWNDVIKTLRGEYGARATLEDPDDPTSLVLYISAPVRWAEKTVGVLTVCKPIVSANLFIASAQRKIIFAGTFAGVVIVVLGFLTTAWVIKPIQDLTVYASRVRDGERSTLPALGSSELGVMARTLDQMREALEGREYVERYVQTLTHELKGPLSSVKGAVELLNEDMPEEKRDRFLKNIQAETDRIQR